MSVVGRKSLLITGIVVLLIAFAFGLFNKVIAKEPKADEPKVEVYKEENGYAYKILYNDKVIINQPFIPAVPGKFVFCTEEDAQKTGELVKNRFILNENPTISVKDIKRLEISLDCM